MISEVLLVSVLTSSQNTEDPSLPPFLPSLSTPEPTPCTSSAPPQRSSLSPPSPSSPRLRSSSTTGASEEESVTTSTRGEPGTRKLRATRSTRSSELSHQNSQGPGDRDSHQSHRDHAHLLTSFLPLPPTSLLTFLDPNLMTLPSSPTFSDPNQMMSRLSLMTLHTTTRMRDSSS